MNSHASAPSPPSVLGSKRSWQASDDFENRQQQQQQQQQQLTSAPRPIVHLSQPIPHFTKAKDSPGSAIAHNDPPPSAASSASTTVGASSSFRNVSACNRCRLRKNRCDQNLPACSSCEKARQKCVGYDPITKREIPRTYVYYCESRISYLENLLVERGIAFAPADDFEVGTKPISTLDHTSTASVNGSTTSTTSSPRLERGQLTNGGRFGGHRSTLSDTPDTVRGMSPWDEKKEDAENLNKLVSNIGMVSVQGASDPRYLGSTSGISFARVVFAAVRSSVSSSSSERAGIKPSKPLGLNATSSVAASGTSMRDSFFGLSSKPTMKTAPFPDRELGEKLMDLYFEYANCQIPILHRGEFRSLFNKVYSSDEHKRSARESYLLNIVFAIGSAIILKSTAPDASPIPSTRGASPVNFERNTTPKAKRQKLSSVQHQPEEYHASAMVHLESFLGSTPATDRPEGFGGSLEELQAVLLLAGFALLRPVAPGLWYIVGVAVRIGVDLGLHYEDGTGIEGNSDGTGVARSSDVAMEAAGDASWAKSNGLDPKERGRREWVRDLRRRLWWCVYSFDRLVSTCVGRPFGISDQVITTEFPCILDDEFITINGIQARSDAYKLPSYKRVAHHYFRLRLLQSEILQVLQHQQAKEAREKGRNSTNAFMYTKLSSPFLDGHNSFRAWRKDIDNRLYEWKESAPDKADTEVGFSLMFLELNYWQAVIMLYRQSLTVPPTLAREVTPSDEISSPLAHGTEPKETDEDVFLKVAEAGQQVLKLYRTLHRMHMVNYTFLATHHLFMAGIAFLYAIWHSPTVRSGLTLDDVDFTVLAGTSVLEDLIPKCPPAEACRDAFVRMSQATINMCVQTHGFGTRAAAPIPLNPPEGKSKHNYSKSQPMAPMGDGTNYFQQAPQPPPPPQPIMQPNNHHPVFIQAQDEHGAFRPTRPKPQLDSNLRELFPDQNFDNLPPGPRRWSLSKFAQSAMPQQQQQSQTATEVAYQQPMKATQQPMQPLAYTQAPPQLHHANTAPHLSSTSSTPTYQAVNYDVPPRSGPSPHQMMSNRTSSYGAPTPPHNPSTVYASTPSPQSTSNYNSSPESMQQHSSAYNSPPYQYAMGVPTTASASTNSTIANNGQIQNGLSNSTTLNSLGSFNTANNAGNLNNLTGNGAIDSNNPFGPGMSWGTEGQEDWTDFLGYVNQAPTFTTQPGMAIGFDADHDWSENPGMDFFDGFFFGAQGAPA
ncbi:Fungal specific transcription factor [Agyrium rufum]|nr:Fungal specific transcription factor [Agyrium rufum]